MSENVSEPDQGLSFARNGKGERDAPFANFVDGGDREPAVRRDTKFTTQNQSHLAKLSCMTLRNADCSEGP